MAQQGDREQLRQQLRGGMQAANSIAQVRPAETDFVCADGQRARFAVDRATRSAVWEKGAEKRTLFRLANPRGAQGAAGLRYAEGGLTITDLGGEIAVQQRPNPAYRCWRVPSQPTPGVLTGTVTYRQRMALPAGSKLTVTLSDVSLMDAPRRDIASVKLTPAVQVPIHWVVRYDAARVTPRSNTYALSARIEAPDGRLLFITDTRNSVLADTPAQPPVELVVVPVGRSAP